ncbi:hypothetical protein FAM6165_00222 [Lacticaseibacillus paracasei]|nr:hypothetical protein [Lacticaseibacillus paracasei]RNE33077.1 hypothetical protein FAM6165_00222 [Lacticaseibacillus paracasei]
MLKPTNVPIVNGLGHIVSHLEKNVRYTFVDHGYYMTALRPGETEEIKPELPEQEWRIANNIQLRNGELEVGTMKFYEFDTDHHDYYALVVAGSPEEAKRIYQNEIDDALDELNPREVSLDRAAEILLEADDLADFHDELVEKEKRVLQGEDDARTIVIDSNLL